MIDDLAPEEIELKKKARILERLTDRLAGREEELAELLSQLSTFEARYSREVGSLYAEMDEIEAAIAEEEYKLVPDDVEIKKRAEDLRRRAEESAARAAELAEISCQKLDRTPDAKKTYHELARTIHPDLAIDPLDKQKRHLLMSELNQAYSAGDQSKLDKLAHDLRRSPDLVSGDSIGDQLVRTIRQISQVNARLREISDELIKAELSETFELRKRSIQEMEEGRDMLKQMAARARVHMRKAERRLANLRTVNEAAKDYVKEKYGMDISDFRP